MKISIVLAALVGSVASSHIHDLKQKILATHGRNRNTDVTQEGIFDYGRATLESPATEVNQIAVKFSQVGHPVQLPKEQQVSRWYSLLETSPMKKMGYESWAPASNGFVFRPSEDKMDSLSMFQCESNLGVRVKDEKATLVQYKCGEVDTSFLDEEESASPPSPAANATSFLRRQHTSPANTTFLASNRTLGTSNTTLFTRNSTTASFIGNTTASFIGNTTASSIGTKTTALVENSTLLELQEENYSEQLEIMSAQRILRMLTPQLRDFVSGGLPKFWQRSHDNKVPYGFASNWENFNYPYYAITDTGCYGCAMSDYITPEIVDKTVNPLTGQESWCKQPVYYPYSQFTKNDLLPTSMYYSSGCGTRWAGSIMPGSTISMQPNGFTGSQASQRTGQTTTSAANTPK